MTSCGKQQLASTNNSPGESRYYAYNPEDTVGNDLYWQLLRIDSARADHIADHPTSNIMENDPMQINHDTLFAKADVEWREFLKLCSKKEYAQATHLYLDHESDFILAMPTSTLKFNFDYYIIGVLLLDHLSKEAALDKYIEILEFDKLQTECVVTFSTMEGGTGYIPPQYAFQIETLCQMYLLQGEREKAESLIEPYREATYLLSDDTPQNEFYITDFKFQIYRNFGDWDKSKEAFVEFRDFLIHHAKETGTDHDKEIIEMNQLIKKMEQPINFI